MNDQFNIKNPCNQPWDKMLDSEENKFCKSCNKTIYDLDNKSTEEIQNLIEKEGKICGKFSTSTINVAAGLLMAVSITAISCASSKSLSSNTIESFSEKMLHISGKLTIHKTSTIASQRIMLVTKKTLYFGSVDNELNFEIKVPESEIKNYNLIKIDHKALNSNKRDTLLPDHSLHILKREELKDQVKVSIRSNYFSMGAVVLHIDPAPDLHYYNGKRISKRKFEKIENENPNYEKVLLSDDVYKKIITSNYSDNIYLLYSN